MYDHINHTHKDLLSCYSVKNRNLRTELLLLPSVGKGIH